MFGTPHLWEDIRYCIYDVLNLCPPNCHSQVSPPRFESAVDDAGIFPCIIGKGLVLTQPSICKWCYWRNLDDYWNIFS